MIQLAKVMAWVWYNENVESAHGRKKLDFIFEAKNKNENKMSNGPLFNV